MPNGYILKRKAIKTNYCKLTLKLNKNKIF